MEAVAEVEEVEAQEEDPVVDPVVGPVEAQLVVVAALEALLVEV